MDTICSDFGQRSQKILNNYDREDLVFAPVIFVLGFLFVKLIGAAALTKIRLGLGVMVFTFLFISVVMVWFKRKGAVVDRSVGAMLLVMALLSAYVAIYQNIALQAFALLILIVLAAYAVLALGKARIEEEVGAFLPFDLVASLLTIPLSHFGKIFAICSRGMKERKGGRTFITASCGAVLAVPVYYYVGMLLQRADAVFASLWQRILWSILSEDMVVTLFQILVSLPVSMYLYGLIFGTVRKKGAPPIEREMAVAVAEKAKALPYHMVIGAVAPLLGVYALFFFSQTSYFTSAFRGVLPQGLVYAEYARSGFFELCTVSVINLLCIAVFLVFTKRQTAVEGTETEGNRLQALPLAGRICCFLLTLSSITMIVIAMSKMALYIGIYGLTQLRLFTSWFMLFLAVVFTCVIVLLHKPEFKLVKCCAYAGIILFLVLCYADTDGRIARYNLDGYRSGKLAQLDLLMLQDMGAQAAPYLLEIVDDEAFDATHREHARLILESMIRQSERHSRFPDDWRTWTITGYRAKTLLADYSHTIYIKKVSHSPIPQYNR
ncbi:MAG: DUF4173 domain-containing protein [Clostridiales bacterium]|nr:DUF4173 domain-containing protein [Clostridiales bacterium]